VASAPHFTQVSNFDAITSTPITLRARAQRATLSMCTPSPPPAPNTATVSCGVTRALRMTLTGVAIASVMTPISAGCLRQSSPGGSLMKLLASSLIYSA